MTLRFFTDHCVPSSIIHALRDAGHEVLVLKEHLPVDSADPDVMTKAQQMSAILLSLDGDFADIVTYPPSRYHGILALQVRNHPEVVPAITQRLLNYLTVHAEMRDYKGRLFLFEAHRLRIRW